MMVATAAFTALFSAGVTAQAQESITVYMPSPAGLADNIAAAFTEETGINVEVFQGTTGEILARLEAEKENPIADVVILASWSDGLNLKADGVLASYELSTADSLVEGFVDEDNQLFGYSASAVGVIYNTLLFEEVTADWGELGTIEEYADQLAMPDPEKSGAAKDFVSGYVVENGWDDFESIASNGLIIPGANKAALESVMTGERGILVAGVDYNGFKSIDEGEPLGMYYPESGTVINPRPAMLMAEAVNPEGGQEFLEFLFSDAAQQFVVDAYLIPGRQDVRSDLRPNVDEIPAIDVNWEEMIEISGEAAARINELAAQ